MARISRKQAVSDSAATLAKRVYRTCLYLRLSKKDSGSDNSDSIEMQEYLLVQYVKAQQDMALSGVFRDNGATGVDFHRPGFERMLEAVRRREIDCIVVKDLSRFGRNYVETGYYLEKIFPFLDVRFVAVGDGYDTLKSGNSDEMVISLKNIVNSLFAKDISKKSGSALRRKQEKGEFIGSWTPYGYIKNPENKHQLIIDPETVQVVRDIFAWRMENIGYGEIARRLNERDIPNPSMLRFKRGEFKKESPQTLGKRWGANTVKRITNNMAYIGHMAQGKQTQSLCDGIKRGEKKKQDWIIVRNTHAPIVEEETWKRVQRINNVGRDESARRRRLPKTENLLLGLVYCKDCGRTMGRYKTCSPKGFIRYTFCCRVRKDSKGMSGCTLKSIGEKELLFILRDSIRIQAAVTMEQEKMQESQTERKKLELSLKEVQTALTKNRANRSTLFESYCDKRINDKDYLRFKRQYDVQASELRILQEKLIDRQKVLLNPYNGEVRLSRTLARALIHHITIEGRNHVSIVWNFKDGYPALLRDAKGARI